ncbi:dynamin family protein [Alteribacillus sp. JSM 102045]|uniref:dynamin family protein n=1 Tax=Alteribacillus sp. JSM 102045 TaxID=1562101 RepID=UPI0035C1EC81
MTDTNISSCFLSENERTALFTKHNFSHEALLEIAQRIQHAASTYECPRIFKNVDVLLKKIEDKRRTAAFCGQFSAGKSTLLNQLIGKDLLPSHPIPTSANIVHFKKGKAPSLSYEDAQTGETKILSENEWKDEWFTSTDITKEVYLQLPVPHFPNNLEILDTPGIDSTEKNHKVLAESRLIEADTVYYMVDYQKVESEENFSFLKQLNKAYISPVLLINQVDKHEEQELAFSLFQERIYKSLQQQNIQVKNIFFLSAARPTVNKKDWDAFIDELFQHDDSTFQEIIQTSALGIYRELEHLASYIHTQIQPSKETLNYMSSYLSLHSLEQEWQEKQETLDSVPYWDRLIEKDIFNECEAIFKNAKITPYHTRNLVRDYLESRQAAFRLKGLFSKNKTLHEKEKRKKKLVDSLNENVKNYIDVHLRTGIQRILSAYRIENRHFNKDLLSIQHKINSDILKKAERKGAQFSQEYVLTFSRFIVDEIRMKYKEILRDLLPAFKEAVREQQKIQTRTLTKEVSTLEGVLQEWKTWEKEYNKLSKMTASIITELKNAHIPLTLPSKRSKHQTLTYEGTDVLKSDEVDISSFYQDNISSTAATFMETKQAETRKIEKAASLLQDVNGLSEIQHSLQERVIRLHQKTYRITLFGAFSTGKSSIANALLGKNFLPVAANPTTASIQYIKAPDSRHSHGSVEISYKTEQEIIEDMNDVVKKANVTLNSIEEWKGFTADNERNETDANEENKEEDDQTLNPMKLLKEEEIILADQFHQSYHQYNNVIGKRIETDHDSYLKLAANEEQAILIKDVTIYFDCDFTRAGYVLTDTPGIGSIYRRHSEIAFEELKKSDALLFISYYNHSFSKADHEFLLQLSRTKNYFSYDKFFFLVNAADLAQHEKELSSVLDYVTDQLVRLGLTEPRVKPISGKKALQCHNDISYWQTSGAEGFIEEFHQFAKAALDQTLIKESKTEIKQAINILQDQSKHLADKQQSLVLQRQNWREQLLSFQKWVQHYHPHPEWQWIEQELEELLFYVKQRVFYRYYDEYKVILNAARFNEKESFSSQLHRFTNELIHFIFYEFAQEIRATIIRMEHFIEKQWKDLQYNILKKLSPEVRRFFVRKNLHAFPDITIYEDVPVNSRSFSFIREYTSYQQFFIEQQNKQLKEQLEEALRPYGDEIMESYLRKLKNMYQTYFYEQWNNCQQEFAHAADNMIKEWKTNTRIDDTRELEQTIHQLKRLI